MNVCAAKSVDAIVSEWDKLAPVRFDQISSGKDITYKHVLCPQIVLLADPLGERRVLDVGCGVGFLSVAVAEKAKSGIAIDPRPGSIEAARSQPRLTNLR